MTFVCAGKIFDAFASPHSAAAARYGGRYRAGGKPRCSGQLPGGVLLAATIALTRP
jgi:hypothetical protein